MTPTVTPKGPPPAAPLTVYVAYYDSRPHPAAGQAPYVALCNVGRDGHRPAGFDQYDDGGGLPAKNELYCELSAQRHLEQRAGGEYLGLCHYRRMFVTARSPRRYAPRSYLLSAWDWSRLDRHGATEVDLLQAVAGRQWCTTPPYDVRWSGHVSLWDQYCDHHPEPFLFVLRDVVRDLHPELPDFRDWLCRTTRLPFFNMFIGRRDRVVQYGAWLWPLLEECERRIGVPDDPYQRRYPGFLAERLHGYWLACVAPRDMSLGRIPVAVVDPNGIVNSHSGGLEGRRERKRPAGPRPPPLSGLASRAVQASPFALRVAVNRALRALPGERSR